MNDTLESKALEVYRGPSNPDEAAALGQLVTHDLRPDVHRGTEWRKPETGLQQEFTGVHLGRKLDGEGWNEGFVDRAETPVPDAGIVFGVAQASHGPTSIHAKPLAGYKVEAAALDPTTNQVGWLQPDEQNDGEVSVVTDHGNLSTTPFDDKWADTNLGNPGTKSGIVRVTGPNGDIKYFALGANFQGEPDDWQVLGGIIEIEPHTTQALPAGQAELPPAE